MQLSIFAGSGDWRTISGSMTNFFSEQSYVYSYPLDLSQKATKYQERKNRT